MPYQSRKHQISSQHFKTITRTLNQRERVFKDNTSSRGYVEFPEYKKPNIPSKATLKKMVMRLNIGTTKNTGSVPDQTIAVQQRLGFECIIEEEPC